MKKKLIFFILEIMNLNVTYVNMVYMVKNKIHLNINYSHPNNRFLIPKIKLLLIPQLRKKKILMFFILHNMNHNVIYVKITYIKKIN